MPGIRLLLILLLLMNLAPGVRAAGDVRLDEVATEETPSQSRVVLNFSSLPTFRVETSGQRVDLVFPDADISDSLREKSEHGRIVKVLFARKKGDLIVSFLLRQPPARILTSTEGSRQLVLEFFWQASPTRTAVAFQVPGVPTMEKGQMVSSMKPSSRYSGDWERFLREHQTPLHLRAPLRYSQPSLPVAAAAEQTGKAYLQSLALATAGNPHQARILLQEAQAGLVKADPLRLFCRLLQAELALTTKEFNEAVSLLERTDHKWPAALAAPRQVRLAAALAKTGKAEQARKAFIALGQPLTALDGDAFSLESAGGAFLAGGEYATAAAYYRELEASLAEPEVKALAGFAWALAAYQGKDRDLAIEKLQELKEAFSAQVAGQRAWLKILDHDVLTGREAQYPAALAGYAALAEQAHLKELREEAAFKLTLVLAWSDQQERSVRHLQMMLRDFRGGVLRAEAEALLAELLPPVIQDMVARGEDLQAVVLAEQSRQVLMSGGMGWAFLLDLASAFNRMGLPDRAGRIYLFMLDSPRKDADKEALYLPLVQSFWGRDDFLQAGHYAGQYLERYPQGRERTGVFLWRLRALGKTGQLAEAAGLLRSSGIPWDMAVELEAARILSALGDFRQLAELAGRSEGKWSPAPEAVLLQAEALREVGREARALPLYRSLLEEETFADQAAFRMGQILLTQGEKKEALKILSRLVETGKSSLWRGLAEETRSAAVN